MCVQLIIHVKTSIYDDVLVSNISLIHNEKYVITNSKLIVALRLNKKKDFNAHLLAVYIKEIEISLVYRRLALKAFKSLSNNTQCIVHLKLRMPKKQFLDYNWAKRMNSLVVRRREIDYAMSWLSTLGGAFSAMGEQFNDCAKMAGKISTEQLKLALYLGDPLLVARCHLYMSLSFIQQDKFSIPKKLIPKIFKYANKCDDKCLARMCQGIWAKLRYSIELYKKKKIN